MPQPPLPAVAAVIRCGTDLLMIRRAEHLRAFPGYWAFPGGQCEDNVPLLPPTPAFCGLDTSLLGNLARELDEELGIDLADLARRNAISRCEVLADATTPPGMPRRFLTHFVAIELTEKPTLTLDPGEIDRAEWTSAVQWLARYRAGEMILIPPHRRILEAYADTPSPQPLGCLDEWPHDPATIPTVELIHGLGTMIVRSHTLPPAHHTNAFVIGTPDDTRLIVDPSPADDDEYQRLLRSCRGAAINAVFITHHHGDHNERADRLARELGCPILLSADTRKRLDARSKGAFFNGIDVREVGDGDVVCRWLGHPVRAHAVPGHDAGQLALAPDNRAWMIVGDLFQGIGTVVISQPEGDMAAYMATLQRVIDWRPHTIIPSHGSPVGGTHRLKQILQHRREREDQVLELANRGHDLDAMVPIIYAEVDSRLWPLARRSLESHWLKLAAEGRISQENPS